MKKLLTILLAVVLCTILIFTLTGCSAVFALPPDPGVTVLGQTLAVLAADFFAAALRLLLFVIVLLFAKILLPFLSETVVPWLRDRHLLGLVKVFVMSAEKKGETGEIEKSRKKDYVLGLLEKRGITITPLVHEMIEACVEELDKMSGAVVEALLEPAEETAQPPDA